MSNFHIGKDGTARKCQAQTPDACRATKTDLKEHFETREEAQKAYEKNMKEKSANSKTLSKREQGIKSGNKRAEELLKSAEKGEKFDIDATLKKVAEHIEKAENKMTPAQRKAYNIRKNQELFAKDNLEQERKKQAEAARLVNLATDIKQVLDEKMKEKDNKATLEVMSEYNDVVSEIVQDNSTTDLNYRENRKTYENNITHHKNYLDKEYDLITDEIKKVEKSGRMKKMLSKEFKNEQENYVKQLDDRLENLERMIQNTKLKERNLRKSEAKRKYDLLVADGFKQAKRYSGWNMSAHPQGPVIEYQCPDCHSVSKVRAGAMSRSKDVGLKAGCRKCERKILIPIKWD